MIIKAIRCFLLLGCLVGAAQAKDVDAGLKQKIAARMAPFINGEIRRIDRAGFGGLYEVITDNGIGYTDRDGSVLIINAAVVDTTTRENLTEKRMNELHAVSFRDLPLKDAVKTVVGDGRRVMATFEDPNCGYCRKLSLELDKLDNVTIYTFLYPVMAPDSEVKARSVWCSADRPAAWRNGIQNNQYKEAPPCDTPFARNSAFAQRHRIQSTPTIFFESGERLSGALPAERLERALRSDKLTRAASPR